MEGCGMVCIKYLLVVFNAIFMVFGIVIIATTCIDLGMLQGFAGMETTGHETDAILIAIGVLIIVVAAFGCFGAWKESPKLLYIFAGCLIIIILLELSVGIATAALRPQLETTMKTQFRSSFIENKKLTPTNKVYRDFWDRIQSSLECCGVTGPENYETSEPSISPSLSCCQPDPSSDKSMELKRAKCLTNLEYYRVGCEDKVLSAVHSAGMTVIVTGILFCFLEAAGIILALWLAHAIKTQGKSREAA